MDKELIDRLNAEEYDEKMVKLHTYLKDSLKQSRDDMGKHYDMWDRNSDVYRGIRPVDAEDIKARNKGEPEQMIVPMSYAQVQTFVTFCVMLYTQNEKIFNLDPTGNEDFDIRDAGERIIERDLRRNKFLALLVQFLLDVSRYGIGVGRVHWTKETVEEDFGDIEEEAAQPFTVSGDPLNPTVEIDVDALDEAEEAIAFEGNVITPISPYNFLPDTRLPITRWREGRFAADESVFHIDEIRKWEEEGNAAGVDLIEPFTVASYEKRGKSRFKEFENLKKTSVSGDEDDFMVCVTQMQVWLKPYKYDLGEGKQPRMFLVKIANDSRIISIEPMNAVHRMFSYYVAPLSPDQHAELSDSLSNLIHALQDVVTWLMNARIASVRKNLDSHMVIHSSYVDMDTVTSRSPFIKLKKNAPLQGIDKFVHQLKTTDATMNHIADAGQLNQMMEIVSGVNGNAMGQYHPGRRSATESKAVTSGSASRMKVTASVIWTLGLEDLGKMILLNHRQNVSSETFAKILGTGKEELYALFKPEKVRSLIGSEDFFVYDATVQSEKSYLAQSLQELFIAIASNPEMLQVLPVDLGAMLREIQALRGVRNLDRFIVKPQQQVIPSTNGPNPTPAPAVETTQR